MWTRDIRQALRIFRREPGFAAAAILTLTLGIGTNTALFAVVEAVLLRPLPFADADALVVLKHRDVRTGLSKQDIAIGDFVDLRARQQVFEPLAAYGGFQSTLAGAREPLRVQGASVTPEIFDVLRIRPALGRGFRADDVREGAPEVAIVSHELWRTELGSDPNVLARSIQLGTTRRMIVGVAPPGFRFPPSAPTDVLVPQRVPVSAPAERKSGWTYVVARLRPGVTVERADADMAAISRQLEREFPQQNQGSRYYAEPLRDALVGSTKGPLVLLMVAVGLVLLVACVNVGNLLLARSLGRQHEMAMRMALGAGRGRLAMQIVAEGLVLALAGGLAGALVAWRAAPALAALVPRSTRIPGLESVGTNGGVLLFAVGASVASALVFSGIACIALRRAGTRGVLAGDRRASGSAATSAARSSLVAAEIATAVVLLVGAGLTLRSFARLISVDPGFTTESVLTLAVALPEGRDEGVDARRAIYDRLFGALEALPDVSAAGAAMVTPLTGNNWTVPLVRPEHPLPSGQRPPDVGWQAASGGYFRALRIPLRAGRFFDARDTPRSAPVVIVSEALAARFFPAEEPVGKRVRLGDAEREIVGVVGDIRRAALTDEPRADMYFPFEQQPGPSITLFIRTGGDPLAALPAVRTAIRGIAPDAVLYETRTLGEIAAESAAVARLAMRLLGGFAAIALALAAVGIYGVMSYSVGRRTRELGTRVALGAAPGDITRLVLRQAGAITLAGLAAGLGAGLAAARALTAILYGVPPWDPVALAAAAALLAATALAASYLPARRASRVDPASALAAE